jgi:regulator of sigma E protease
MFDFIWNLMFFIVAIGILVTFHEYGHFWVARKCGVKVERFSIGFGKALWRTKDKYDTEYVIAMIPLGGYVKMLDDRVDDVLPEDKNRTFNSKSVYQRIAIIAAGPIANFLLAIVAYYFVFLIGTPSIKPVIGVITPQSISAKSNLPINSQLIEISGQRVTNWQDVNMAFVAKIGDDSVEISTRTFDSQHIYTHTLDIKNWQYQPDKEAAFTSLGIEPYRPQGTCEIAQVQKGSPAEKAGIQLGDTLISVNQKIVTKNCINFTETIQSLASHSISLTVLRDGKNKQLFVDLADKQVNDEIVGYLGIGRKFAAWPEEYTFDLTYGLFDALLMSLQKTWDISVFSFDMIGKLITGDVSMKNLSGPIGIAQGAGSSAGYGFVYFLSFIALFSINLGIFNLLPLPVLDGGHLLYYLIELLTGKPVPEKVQELGFKIGAFALFSLMAMALLNDLSRL